jgi:CheY-like chemotaxis protein
MKEFTRRNALVVDDDVFCLEAMISHLKRLKFKEYVKAKNGLEGLQKIKEFALKNKFFDLIIMDCDMDVMNGFEASKKINEMIQRKLIPFVPIIAATANVSTANESFCKKAGMHYYLPKPISFSILQGKIKEIFE